jgi:hypothetical protein
VLVADDEPLYFSELQDPIMVLREDGCEITIGHREDWQVLDVRIVFDRVSYYVVRVVRLLPPTHANAGQKVTKANAKVTIETPQMGKAVVAAIMAEPCHLLEVEA